MSAGDQARAKVDALIAEDKAPLFRVESAAEFAAGAPPESVVHGLIFRGSLAFVYGDAAAGKTFLALDLVLSVARGVPWRDLPTAPGRVLYVVAEGVAGVRRRLNAYATHHGLTLDTDLEAADFIAATPDLSSDAHADGLIRLIQQLGCVRVLVIDTLAASTAGADENSGQDMGAVLARLTRIQNETGACVLVIHHAGKDAARGARGWSGLRGAADTMLEVSRRADCRIARVAKQKDGEDGQSYAFELVTVTLEDGSTSCVVRHTDDAPQAVAPKLGEWERRVVTAASDLTDPGCTVLVSVLIDAVMERTPRDPSEDKRDRRREYITRAIRGLTDRGLMTCKDDRVRLMPHASPKPHEAARGTRPVASLPHVPRRPVGARHDAARGISEDGGDL